MTLRTLGTNVAALDKRYARLDRANPLGLEGWYVVGTRPPTDYTGSGNGNVGYNGRLKDNIAVDCTDLRLVYSGPMWLEQDGSTNTVVTDAGVELAVGGTILPVTFGGRTDGTHDAGGLIASNPVPGPFTKGSLWWRTFTSTLTGVVGTLSTTSGSVTATVTSYGYGKGQLTIGAFIYGAGITGFANKVDGIVNNADGTTTVTLHVAASSTATGTFYSNNGQGQITHLGYIDGSDFGAAPATTSPDLSKSGALTSNTANSTGPTLVLGKLPTGATPPPCVAVIGDSIVYGVGWTATDSASRKGTSFATIGMGAGGAAGSTPAYDTPFINLGKGNETGATFAVTASSWRRRRLIGFCSHALVLYGTNDLASSPSLATMQAMLTTIWTQLANKGIKVWACTIPPQTLSTDTWATTGNQTPLHGAPTEVVRTQVNDWIRTKPTPLTGYFDTADTVETSRNSGVWKVGYINTADGLGVHPNNTGHLAMGAAIDRTKFV